MQRLIREKGSEIKRYLRGIATSSGRGAARAMALDLFGVFKASNDSLVHKCVGPDLA